MSNEHGAALLDPEARHNAASGLSIESLSVAYDKAVAVDRLSLIVKPGEIVALLGANGAGKTSLLNAISGLVPSSGSVAANGRDLTLEAPQVRARHIAHVPEGRRLFPQHTVLENLTLAAFGAKPAERATRLEIAYSVLPRLAELADRKAFALSGGEQQMVAVGRGLMGDAQILMIDELSLGLAPRITSKLGDALVELKLRGYAILLVEQYVSLALRVSDRVVSLERGRVVAEGDPAHMRDQTDSLRRSYLGGPDDRAEPSTSVSDEATIEVAETADASRDLVNSIGAPVLGILAFIAAAVATVSPWFRYDTGVGSGTLSPWQFGAAWAVVVIVAHAVVAACGLGRLRRRTALSLSTASAALGAGLTGFATVISRTWLLERGLPGADIATYSRVWGLLVALHASGFAVASAALMTRESWHARTAAEAAS